MNDVIKHLKEEIKKTISTAEEKTVVKSIYPFVSVEKKMDEKSASYIRQCETAITILTNVLPNEQLVKRTEFFAMVINPGAIRYCMNILNTFKKFCLSDNASGAVESAEFIDEGLKTLNDFIEMFQTAADKEKRNAENN